MASMHKSTNLGTPDILEINRCVLRFRDNESEKERERESTIQFKLTDLLSSTAGQGGAAAWK